MTLSMIDEPATFAAQIAHLNAQHIVLDVDGIYFKVTALGDTVTNSI